MKPAPEYRAEDYPTPPTAVEIFGDRLPRAEAYHQSLATDGMTRGFIGPRELPRLWDRHILNCAVISEAMPHGCTVADIGSGAGLPGIPLAIARPDLRMWLIEPLLKRSVYLQALTEELDLRNVQVIRGRAEEKAVRSAVAPVDVVTSRAVAPLGKLTRWSLPLARRGGAMIAMKGSSVGEEIERDAKEIRSAGGLKPEILQVGERLLDQPTTLVRIRRRA